MMENRQMSPHAAQNLIADQLTPQHQQPAQASGPELPDTIARLGLPDDTTIARILEFQQQHNLSFGNAARRLRLLSKPQLRYALGVHIGAINETYPSRKIPDALFTIENPYSPISDGFRSVANKVYGLIAEDQQKHFCFASDKAVTQSVLVTLNLAATFAVAGERVLMIDAGDRPSMVWQALNMSPRRNASIIAAGSPVGAATHNTIVNRLSLLAFGATSQENAKLFSKSVLAKTFAQCAPLYDRIFIHSSPRTPASYNESLWEATRNIITIVRKDHSRASALAKLKRDVRAAHADIVGAIIVK